MPIIELLPPSIPDGVSTPKLKSDFKLLVDPLDVPSEEEEEEEEKVVEEEEEDQQNDSGKWYFIIKYHFPHTPIFIGTFKDVILL